MLSDKYTVRRVDDHDLAPEETLADAISGHSLVEIPIGKNVFRFFALGMILVIVILAVQAFRLQILQGGRFAAIADRSRLNQYPIPSIRGIIYDRNGQPLVQNVPVFDLVAVRSELMKANDPQYAAVLAEHVQDAVFVIDKDISKERAIQIQATHTPGLYIVPYARRQYMNGPAFAHILGYTGSSGNNDREGRLGLEASYNSVLHGEPQSVVLALDRPPELPAVPGENLQTNIDKDIQEHLYRALKEVFASSGVTRGAAIIQDVHTGAVLGLVSMPTFDPNNLNEKVLTDQNHPLFNRVVSGLYPTGSTIKPLYALAALKEKIISPLKQILAEGAIQVQSEVDASVQYTFKDWKVHGWSDMRKAIADSVDVYFYAIGGGYQGQEGLGVDRLSAYLKLFWADQKTGIDLPAEAKGFVPTKAWKKETKGESWYVGDTYNLSIGQGDLLVTPLWINSYISAVANGGTIYRPEIVKQEPEVLTTVSFDDATWRVIHEGMRQTVTDGTAQLLKDLPRAVAAKTGTAQVGGGKALNSLFVVYGPYEDPQISMTILVENIPQSQSLAVRVAKDFLSWYFQGDR